jgi:hypothetical protein
VVVVPVVPVLPVVPVPVVPVVPVPVVALVTVDERVPVFGVAELELVVAVSAPPLDAPHPPSATIIKATYI